MSSMEASVLYRLKNLNDHNIISVCKNQFKIGRATTNDLAMANNRYMSSCHCIIEFSNGHVYIRDTSSNGTLINRSKKINKNDTPMELLTGDIVHLVFRKDEPESNVIFQLDLPIIIESKTKTEKTLKRKLSDTLSISANETKENVDLSNLMNKSPDVEMKPTNSNDLITMKAGDDMEDILTCVCCQDIMTNPICLEPCLHVFCSDCYASWEPVQRTCPKCRVKVTDKKKNVVINGILEAYLKVYPNKRPTLNPIDSTKNAMKTTTSTKIEVNRNITSRNDDQSNDEMDDESVDNDIFLVTAAPISNVQFTCRQCPTPRVFGRTSNMNTVLNGFQCRPNQRHILCQCCTKPMPDRQDEPNIHQSCEICQQHFCNIYFQECQRADCLGCLNHLRDFNFNRQHLTNIINNNPIETLIIQNYLKAHRGSSRDLFVECCQRLDRKEFTCTGIDRNMAVPSAKVVCYKCGLNIFRELAYQFRVAMKPTDILPMTLRNRENCFYGKHCRTQYTKPAHAQKFNHACEQTKD
ncbi:unnamed protein product [Rotaria magnacalcarata]|uniref:E3 ubiquitin-protein ligase CHFR n=2 Tax=Rotaria magnacalcarata TaxID=392030 RepID=A0A816RD53_9BILA|nr:unnamed protein product [Rotaria magnacalcarata]